MRMSDELVERPTFNAMNNPSDKSEGVAFIGLILLMIWIFFSHCGGTTEEPATSRNVIIRSVTAEDMVEALQESDSHVEPLLNNEDWYVPSLSVPSPQPLPVPPVVRSPSPVALPQSPQARAAESLLESGRAALTANQSSAAEAAFDEAIRLSPAYGPAYYWKAKQSLQQNDRARASDYLNRATLLLRDDPEWQERLRELREE